jgi:hypothetical protein
MLKSPNNEKVIIRRSRNRWRVTWSTALLFLASCYLIEFFEFELILYFFYFYLLVFGFVELLISRQIWAQADVDELVLCYGSFITRRSIRIKWSDINKIEKKGVARKIALGGEATAICEADYDALVLSYDNKSPESMIIKKYSSEGIQINPEMGTIAIFEKPEGGLDFACDQLSGSVNKEKNLPAGILGARLFDTGLFAITVSSMLYTLLK